MMFGWECMRCDGTKVAKIKQACESGETRRKKQHKQMIDEKAEDSDTRKQDYPTKKTRV